MNSIDDNFDLVLAIPCKHLKEKRNRSRSNLNSIASSSLEKFSDGRLLKCGEKEMEIKNFDYDNKKNLEKNARIFCEQIEEHGKYELVYNDDSGKIETKRTPLVYGQVIIYKDEKNDDYIPECCYNFFAVLSKLTLGKASSEKDAFNLIYFVIPNINYHDLTLLMDQSHEIWCNIGGKYYGETEGFFKTYLTAIGYKYLGKIYRIVFSDLHQFEMITKDNKSKLFNILASEEYKNEDEFCHQIELSESTDEYSFSYQGDTNDVNLTKKERFFDDYTMYSSYNAYASIYSYYYVIKEKDKDSFYKRIAPDTNNANFSSEANILFVLETEISKITASIVLSEEINEQIDNADMVEIQKMFKSFIKARPLFEKLNYCYLGAQKEADFIYKQFRISDVLADYDRKRELLKSYSEVTSSITANKNAKILNCIGILFTFIGGWDLLSSISKILFDNEKTVVWNEGLIIPVIGSLIIIGIILKISDPVKPLKRFLKNRFRRVV